jgi:hypothetical protein
MPMDMPMPKLKYSRNIPMAYAVEEDEDELPMPPTFSPYSATYAIPKGKLYASGARKKRVKRVMSQAQKDALAKGRHALRIKLNDMGAGVKKKKIHKSGALQVTEKSIFGNKINISYYINAFEFTRSKSVCFIII